MSDDTRSKDDGKLLYCSFCGKSQHEVRKLIAGPSVFVCDECVELCNDIIREELEERSEHGGDSLPTPHEIKAVLGALGATTFILSYERFPADTDSYVGTMWIMIASVAFSLLALQFGFDLVPPRESAGWIYLVMITVASVAPGIVRSGRIGGRLVLRNGTGSNRPIPPSSFFRTWLSSRLRLMRAPE